MTRRLRIVFACTLLLVAAGGLSGCSVGRRPSKGRMTVEELKSFSDFPVYWLGEEYDGNRLNQILRVHSPRLEGAIAPGENVVAIIYGACRAADDAGCPPPVSVRVEPACDMTLAFLRAENALDGESFEIRGAPAAYVSGHVRIFTKDATISVFSGGDADVVTVAHQLVAANSARFPSAALPSSPADQLPAVDEQPSCN